MTTLLTIGETLAVASTPVGTPLRNAADLHLSTAGAESTVAIGVRRLGHTAAWVGVLGADELGARVHRELAAEGVDTRFVRFVPDAPTGFMLRDHRTRDYVSVSYYREHGSGTRLGADDVEAAFAAFDGIDMVHLTGITTALSPSCRAAVLRAVELARSAAPWCRSTSITAGRFPDRHRRMCARSCRTPMYSSSVTTNSISSPKKSSP
ncbi:PfkB family carbohydrate kinase [Actinomadura yumaensis]|uniref:PfkB family carbohydrate kinase n=1 Tax=Actinomadura yumaensis TaxID=111807 RepID=UPI0036075B4B